MEPEVIWIKIDPNLLIEGFDCQGFFGADSFLKFNIPHNETIGDDKVPESTNPNSTDHKVLNSNGLETTSSGEVEDIKIEQDVKSEFDQDLKPDVKSTTILQPKLNNRQGIPSVCSECGLTFNSMARLKDHLSTVHNTDLRFPCDHCDKKFLRKSLLGHKRFIVEKELKVSCEVCQQNHETKNHREPIEQCKNCSRKFVTKKNYDLHMLQAFCDPAKWRARRLERKREAEKSGQFNCTFEKCEKQYLSNSHLERHIMTHTNERPFQCDNCGQAFTQKGTLKEHIRVHTGERPYQCSECPNSYAQGGSFHAHMRSHNEAKAAPDRPEVKTRPKVEIYHNNKKIF